MLTYVRLVNADIVSGTVPVSWLLDSVRELHTKASDKKGGGGKGNACQQ